MKFFTIAISFVLIYLTVSCKKEGCTDPIAENYDQKAKEDDQSCQYIYGCMNEWADNYCEECTRENNSCKYSGSIVFYLRSKDRELFNFNKIKELTLYLNDENIGGLVVDKQLYRQDQLPGCNSPNTITRTFEYDSGYTQRHFLRVHDVSGIKLYGVALETRASKCWPFYISL